MSLGLAVLCACVGAGAFLTLGYLLGLWRGRVERDALRRQLSDSRGEVGLIEAALKNARAELEESKLARSELDRRLREQLQVLNQANSQLVSLQRPQAPGAELSEQIDLSIKSVLKPLLQRDLQTRELREALDDLLRPMVERERLGLELMRLEGNLSGRAALSQFLTAIAERAGFSTVLVTDNGGLPLAQSDGAQSVEVLGASVGLLLNLVERIADNGAPAPLAVVLRDSDNGVALHRIFKVERQRYVLTAVSTGSFLSPEMLDPTLARIERILTTRPSA